MRCSFPRSLPLLAALATLALLLLTACAGGGAPADAPAPGTDPADGQLTVDEILALEEPDTAPADTPTEPDAEEPAPSVNTEEPAALDALVFIQPRRVQQGSVFLVAVDAPGAAAASVAFDGGFYSLIHEDDRFFTILPVDAQADTGPLSVVVSIADATGRPALAIEAGVDVLPTVWPTEVVEIDDENSRLLDPDVVAEDLAVRTAIQLAKTPERLWRDFFLQPTPGVITSTFGVRRSYNFADPTDYHTGMDHAGALGEPVVAPNEGVVAWTGETERRGRGIIIDHGGGLFTTFWHLSSTTVETGQPVGRGQAIGRIGNTGLSTGPHLHWEVVVHGVPVDPLPWIRQAEVIDPLAPLDATLAVNAPAGSGARSAPNGALGTEAAR